MNIVGHTGIACLDEAPFGLIGPMECLGMEENIFCQIFARL
jgi:hypothetical protein